VQQPHLQLVESPVHSQQPPLALAEPLISLSVWQARPKTTGQHQQQQPYSTKPAAALSDQGTATATWHDTKSRTHVNKAHLQLVESPVHSQQPPLALAEPLISLLQLLLQASPLLQQRVHAAEVQLGTRQNDSHLQHIT
jgi:hypothetical protein